ncbi:MAG TPA: hypothetical protein VK543_13630, partial [Puia sp.]|nr:hypothetical protein [Puia sp.]
VIGFPSVNRDTVYFTASHNGRDQLFCVINHQIYQAVSTLLATTTGNYQLQAAADQYAWTYFTAAGYKSAVAPRNRIQWQPISPEQFSTALATQSITALHKSGAGLLDQIQIHDYPVTHYPSTLKLVNFHSWRPYIADPDYELALVSENVMSTLQSEIFVGYNRNEHSKQIGMYATYGALYPWITAGFDFTFDRNAIFNNRKIYWNQAQVRVGLSVPLNLSKGKWNRSLKFGSDLVYNQPYFYGQYKSFSDSFGISSFAYVDPKVNFINQSQMARQQINPSWAQAVALDYERAITRFTSHQFLASGYFYFPGITATHSLVLSAAFQQRDSTNHVQFTNSFPFSRGYSAENFYQLYRLGLNYHFPLAYPDWGFADLVYFLRIRANLFYDYTMANDFYRNGSAFRQNYRSLGTEIYFDSKWWNQLPISFGIRYSRLLDPDFEGRGPNQWQFILPLTLLGK